MQSPLDANHPERLARARASLEGLSIGDALGGFFEFGSINNLSHFVKTQQVPNVSVWRFTDDTNMALSIFSLLRQFGEIDQDKLVYSFARHFDRSRGYGPGAVRLLSQMQRGGKWRELVKQMFNGQGSFGNGAAMRIAPLGAYFADDLAKVVEQAKLSSEVTHAHPEGIAGGIGVAVATAFAWRTRGATPTRPELIEMVLPYLPEGEVKQGAIKARDLPTTTTVREAVAALGNGSRVSAQDSVPFVLWCAGEKLANFQEAIWLTASGGGDVDTTCAMVGGIVAAHLGSESIPADWLALREDLPEWTFNEYD